MLVPTREAGDAGTSPSFSYRETIAQGRMDVLRLVDDIVR